MSEKLRIGVFGGYRGSSMIQVLLHHPDAELVAVCDKYQPLLDKAKAEAEAAGLNIRVFNNFDDFLAYDMDAVVLANYATEHATFAIRCLRAGKHVMSEVLPSETMAQAVELIETVEETGLVYTYAENYCYMDLTFEMWRKYREGEIGDVTYAECEYVHDCASCWLDITYGDPNHWRNHLCPTFYCTHSLGPIMTITGRRPVQVVGFENPPIEEFYHLGHAGGHASGIEMVTLDNGAIVKSIHGPLKLTPITRSTRRRDILAHQGTMSACTRRVLRHARARTRITSRRSSSPPTSRRTAAWRRTAEAISTRRTSSSRRYSADRTENGRSTYIRRSTWESAEYSRSGRSSPGTNR